MDWIFAWIISLLSQRHSSVSRQLHGGRTDKHDLDPVASKAIANSCAERLGRIVRIVYCNLATGLEKFADFEHQRFLNEPPRGLRLGSFFARAKVIWRQRIERAQLFAAHVCLVKDAALHA